ncbi:hypothetical protein IQ254_06725 [Nodosilinea sp. LEGE 07088]|uniref:hypothetical protein n=1 Tax=Nodosilinea sp. LEGE 07088 TaxID=2777968 RepID=UPI0018809A3A|nr:hypothetical protein [Nodosilinea sp. LEGE 07088]MBE9136901.1 hypothetical protein [Nodosilinea sp. LEGE 07088]
MADLSGTWLGTYWQQDHPTRFEVTLVQGGNTLSGSILDDGYLGEAQLVGRVAGRQVSFVKRYLTQQLPSIDYVGTVSEDGNHLAGQWNIAGFDAGPWEAYRSEDDLTASWNRVVDRQLVLSAD